MVLKIVKVRGGVKLEFVRNSFDSIRRFAIRLIRKDKKYSKNSMKICSKFVRFDSTPPLVKVGNTGERRLFYRVVMMWPRPKVNFSTLFFYGVMRPLSSLSTIGLFL